MWCPSCGTEYGPGSTQCPACRVSLLDRPPDDEDSATLVELGTWPRLQAQVLRRRLETAGIPVMVEWTTSGDAPTGLLLVPGEHEDFAGAVVNEIDVDDEVADTSPHAYVARLEELLSAASSLLDELRTRLDEMEAEADD